ncbi:hypothetical protein LEP1GSC202_0720 [Leptospira yanagawae serovar Saopaulo str. Sao Paulo = ATCC 700523]|uniref:Uncharacterized protein n=1 Tax=Leptospira yanagawae serovar Saopaulo str. Sao Paulo = ATCC 700523 TaxID=1249483 RepID=A0A5E8HCY2_9LEPT|nr:hypothetical protein LEP1GSC202_0720 [Leptospira yanagawae serovar Saopaulo str. Sao Paulo = ATCC 700523]
MSKLPEMLITKASAFFFRFISMGDLPQASCFYVFYSTLFLTN